MSASTDSTLRMWDVQAHRASRTFSGHMNEKNFVGLSVDGDFTACGSETNEVWGPAVAACRVLSLGPRAAVGPTWWSPCCACLVCVIRLVDGHISACGSKADDVQGGWEAYGLPHAAP